MFKQFSGLPRSYFHPFNGEAYNSFSTYFVPCTCSSTTQREEEKGEILRPLLIYFKKF